MWTDDVGNIGAVLAGYQFASADAGTLDELLDDIVLPAFESFGATHAHGTLAGRDVTIMRNPNLLALDGAPRA